MKKHHHKKASGGAEMGEKDFGSPRDDWKEEESSKPARYNQSKVEDEAEEKKHGGRARKKRKHGGVAVHHEKGEHMKHAKHIGPVHGKPKVHAGRAPRKAGGRTGSNFSPLSSAHAGTAPKDHKTTEVD